MTYRKEFKYAKLLAYFLITILSVGCDKFVDTQPPSSKVSTNSVYGVKGTAIAAVTEQYGKLSSLTGTAIISLTAGLSGDELTLYNGVTTFDGVYKNDLKSTISIDNSPRIWTNLYSSILSANASLEGLSDSKTLTPSVKSQLMGECHFMRAFYYFYLVNFYGDVPLILSSDPNINYNLSRSSLQVVYEQIISDLLEAQKLLTASYVNGEMIPYSQSAERVRPNKAAATALLSRVYLFTKRYSEAEAAATDVINQSSLYELLNLNQVFLKNSKETIWALQPVRNGRNTDMGFMFILPINGPNTLTNQNGNPVWLSNAIFNTFEIGDQRAVIGNWVNRLTTSTGTTYNYPFKYKVKSNATLAEYDVVLRLAEQYLIRSEARAGQNKLIGPNSASSDLNIIRERAGLSPITISTQEQFVNVILNERKSELFTEWGHRWLDIKRLKKVDDIMNMATVQKGNVWKSYQQLYPIPFQDIQLGPNLKQNIGY